MKWSPLLPNGDSLHSSRVGLWLAVASSWVLIRTLWPERDGGLNVTWPIFGFDLGLLTLGNHAWYVNQMLIFSKILLQNRNGMHFRANYSKICIGLSIISDTTMLNYIYLKQLQRHHNDISSLLRYKWTWRGSNAFSIQQREDLVSWRKKLRINRHRILNPKSWIAIHVLSKIQTEKNKLEFLQPWH